MQSKIFTVLFLGAVLMGMSMIATSCNNDDDDENTSKSDIKTCYANVDNQRIEYKYAYLYRAYLASENTYQYDLEFCNYDLIYYMQHPEKISDDIIVSSFHIDIETSIAYDANNLPVGEIEYNDYDCEINMNTALSDIIGDNDDSNNEQWYTTDWNRGFESGPLIISKADGFYIIELRDLKLLASDPNSGNDGIGSNHRKTTGSFYFEGIPQFLNMGDLDESTSYRATSSLKEDRTLIMRFIKK